MCNYHHVISIHFLVLVKMAENAREKDRDRSRRGERPSRFSDVERDRSHDRDRPSSKRLFVSNIPYEYRWTELKDLFKEKVRYIILMF